MVIPLLKNDGGDMMAKECYTVLYHLEVYGYFSEFFQITLFISVGVLINV